MYWTSKHVLVCTASHCAQKGSNELIGRLRLEIIRRGLDSHILINNCGTIDLCDIGPNVVIYPDNVILSGVQARDVKRLADYLAGDGEMDDFITSPASRAERQRRDFYAAAIASNRALTEQEFTGLAAEHDYDQSWIDEQARRGFIARKPAPDTGETVVTVTTKTRNRYSV
jgi:(2Fe-2S) ferredoxin